MPYSSKQGTITNQFGGARRMDEFLEEALIEAAGKAKGRSMYKRISSLNHVGGAYLNALRIFVYVEAHLLLYWCIYLFSSRYARKISRRVLNDSFQGEIRDAIAWLEEVSDNDVFHKGD